MPPHAPPSRGPFNPHMSQTADADHAHFFTRPACQWRSGEYVVIPAHNKGATPPAALAGDEYAEHIAHERRLL